MCSLILSNIKGLSVGLFSGILGLLRHRALARFGDREEIRGNPQKHPSKNPTGCENVYLSVFLVSLPYVVVLPSVRGIR